LSTMGHPQPVFTLNNRDNREFYVCLTSIFDCSIITWSKLSYKKAPITCAGQFFQAG
jgi:hypothetical protein